MFLKDLLKVNRDFDNRIVATMSQTRDGLTLLLDESMPNCPRC